MSTTCCDEEVKFDGISAGFRRALIVVIAVNAAMFVVETSSGFYAESMALRADALDFLGDTLTYAITLLVIGQPLRRRAAAAMLKGASLALMGLWVFAATLYQALVLEHPNALVMGSVGLLALAANLASVLLLLRWRDGDANVRSVWLCSRNDAIANVAVILAAAGVFSVGNAVPDLIVAGIIASLFLYSSVKIVAQARRELVFV
ncbi:MAG: cation transporter [Gammaproteobacteria bacterium]|nr:cation transporter [Gammaproteobacteria bacterium]MDH3412971.1 cation transporter [Gammaproteobacteria bacterium]